MARDVTASLTRRLFLAALAGHALAAVAQPGERVRETLVKAAFLHKFPGFVEWPAGTFASSEAPLRIGVVGDEEVLRDLRELARDRAGDGRPVMVSRVQPGESLAGFHMVYIRAASLPRMADVVAAAPEGVLTVVDSEAHVPGAVLNFFVEDGRVRFGASVTAAAKQRLRLSSRLLMIARQVQGLGPGDAYIA